MCSDKQHCKSPIPARVLLGDTMLSDQPLSMEGGTTTNIEKHCRTHISALYKHSKHVKCVSRHVIHCTYCEPSPMSPHLNPCVAVPMVSKSNKFSQWQTIAGNVSCRDPGNTAHFPSVNLARCTVPPTKLPDASSCAHTLEVDLFAPTLLHFFIHMSIAYILVLSNRAFGASKYLRHL